jgi:glycosyltransferase involved in cell wall biosynthesis
MILTFLKKMLDEHLSLSARLFMKELLIGLPRRIVRIGRAPRETGERTVVLVFDERIPTPDRDAGSLRMFIILKTLAAWCQVIFIPYTRSQSSDYERALWREGIETVDVTDYRRLLKLTNVKAAIVSRPSMAEVFIPRIRRLNPNAGIIFDTVDIHFVRLEREYEVSKDPLVLAEARRYRELETRLVKSSDIVWCASTVDKEVIEREAKSTEFAVVPTIHELRDRGKPFEERQHLLFVGGFAHRPNEDAVLFLIQRIYPLLKKLLPGVQLHIIGNNPSPAITAYNSPDIRIHGYVPDIEPYLQSSRVFVAPLRFGGAGTKGKVGEAMAHGIPVVTTAIGAEGFGLRHKLDVMIADDPESFAAAIQQLYSQKELWERVAQNSRMRIEKHFTPAVIAETINNSLKESFAN